MLVFWPEDRKRWNWKNVTSKLKILKSNLENKKQKSKNSHREQVKSKNNFKTFQYRDIREKTTGIQMKYYPSEQLLVFDVSFGNKVLSTFLIT